MSKEPPILFTGEMVRAILDGRKTQTRRTRGFEHINTDPNKWTLGKSPESYTSGDVAFLDMADPIDTYPTLAECPYGKVGDRLWCKEDYKYRIQGDLVITYYKFSIDKNRVIYTPLGCLDEITRKKLIKGKQDVWKSKLLMFKFMARIWLGITGIKVERVQDIDENDACAEGCELYTPETNLGPERTFQRLWDSINKGRGYGWDVNPYVWALEFRKVENKQYPKRRNHE